MPVRARRRAPVRRPPKVVVPQGAIDAHNALVDRCLLWLSEHGQPFFWSHETGAKPVGRGKAWISFGLKGSSDIIGSWKRPGNPIGQFTCIECKTGKAVLEPQQELFKAAALKAGAIHITARSTKDLEVLL
jgi:hypothetical protein